MRIAQPTGLTFLFSLRMNRVINENTSNHASSRKSKRLPQGVVNGSVATQPSVEAMKEPSRQISNKIHIRPKTFEYSVNLSKENEPKTSIFLSNTLIR